MDWRWGGGGEGGFPLLLKCTLAYRMYPEIPPLSSCTLSIFRTTEGTCKLNQVYCFIGHLYWNCWAPPPLYKNLNMHLIVYTTKKLGQDTWPHHVNWEILQFPPLYWFCPIHWRKPIYHSRCLGDDANNLSEPPEHHSTQGVQALTPGHTNCAAYFRWFMTALLNPFTPEEVIWRHSFRERRPKKGFCCANTLKTRDLSPITLL